MSKTLYLPEHLAQKLNAERNAAAPSSELTTQDAYVRADERVLDPSLLQKPLIDRLPQPTGWRILVMPYQGQEKTTGGLYVPEEVRERERVATVVAYVLRVGPEAYKDPAKFGPNCEPWCKEGQWVCIGRYAGSRFKIDGGEVRILNDDEIIATIADPSDVKHI